MSDPEKREVVGKTEYSGTLYHGSTVKKFDSTNPPDLELTVPYRDTYIKPREDYAQDATSSTLGPGFYATSEREEAIKYAFFRTKRSGWNDPIPLLYQLSIPAARFFDFRSSGEKNGRVPLEIASQWKDYFLGNVNSLMPQVLRQNLDRLNSYVRHLKDFIDRLKIGREFEPEPFGKLLFPDHPTYLLGIDPHSRRNLDLRDLLRSYPSDHDYMWSPFGGLWVRFVEDELSCNGVILLEAGEGKEFNNSVPTYAIYNLGIVKNQQIEALSA